MTASQTEAHKAAEAVAPIDQQAREVLLAQEAALNYQAI